MKVEHPYDSPMSRRIASKRKKILIYGGSSSVGALAVKSASDVGYNVIATSSPSNRDFVSKHGAAHVIDHTLPFDQVLLSLIFRGPYDAVFDAIGTSAATELLGALQAENGGVCHTTLPVVGREKLPANVERRFASYPDALEKEHNADIRTWFYETYLPKGLADAKIILSKVE